MDLLMNQSWDGGLNMLIVVKGGRIDRVSVGRRMINKQLGS